MIDGVHVMSVTQLLMMMMVKGKARQKLCRRPTIDPAITMWWPSIQYNAQQ